jgi:hypothetical protein
MGDYMIMVLEDERAHAARSPKEMAELIDGGARFADSLRKSGKLRDSGRLHASKDGKRVRASSVERGPFGENDKALGAYFWVEASSVEEAAKLATECPVLPSDAIDVRPLMKGNVQPGKDDKPGKIFAFAVLGNRPSEDAWVKLMDQIDSETHSSFPDESFLGGFRLEAPKRGKRVERRAMLDGPFLESKEVIGGVFFLRLASIDEAVAWARETRFVVHGALEIRELWRT